MPIELPLRVAVTGGAGYIGGLLIQRLQEDPDVEHMVAVDVRSPSTPLPSKCAFLRLSVEDRTLADRLRGYRVNALLHLAFILNPIHDEAAMRRINVGGTANLLEACDALGIGNIVVASSGVTYGAKPGHAGFMTEDHPLDQNNSFSYAAHKIEVEKLCREFQEARPDCLLRLLRPSVVVGPNVDNYLSRYLQKRYVFIGRGFDPPMQFIHEEDAAGMFHAVLKSAVRGAFNACGDGVVAFTEVAGLLRRSPIPVPVPLLRLVNRVGWQARLSWIAEAPPGLVDYILYPWLMDNTRAKSELGYRFQFTGRQALDDFLNKNPQLKSARGGA
jgi:UDP-glucose 4-epimerase